MQPAPYQSPFQQPRKQRHILRNVLIAIGALIVLFIILGIVLPAPPSPKSAAAPAPAATTSAAARKHHHHAARHAPGLHQAVHDGDFAFTVESVSCGASAADAVDADGVGEKVPAGALECIVTMRVANDKGTAQTFFDADQYAYDSRGRQYTADSDASIFLTGDQDDTQVNPGIAITAKVPFQIPATDHLARLVLHDSAFSGGVKVRI